MKCNICGAELLKGDICPECGQNISFYKKCAARSNSYYNAALEKAKARNLTGAISLLKTSLFLDKKNINARNLLGLCYYERGDVVEGVSQWIISRKFKSENNRAIEYIEYIESDSSKFNEYTAMVRKYNEVLEYAHQGSIDIAMIQLKNVVQKFPKFSKAQALMGLFYMYKDAYMKGEKALNQALSIDSGNTVAANLLQKLQKLKKTKKQPKTPIEILLAEDDNVNERAPLSGDDVIIPESAFKKTNMATFSIINIIIGIAIGAAVIFFLVVPAKERLVVSDYNQTIEDYSKQLSEANSKLTDANSNVESITKERDALKTQLGEVSGDGGVNKYLTTLIQASEKFVDNDIAGTVEVLTDLDSADVLPNDAAKTLYNNLKEKTFSQGSEQLLTNGKSAYNSENYETAANLCSKAYKADNKLEEAVYYAAKSYEALNNADKAKENYRIIINNFADGQYFNEATAYVSTH